MAEDFRKKTLGGEGRVKSNAEQKDNTDTEEQQLKQKIKTKYLVLFENKTNTFTIHNSF